MRKLVDFVKKYWKWLVGGVGVVAGIILAILTGSSREPPPHIEKPEEDPPDPEKPVNVVAEHTEAKEVSDDKIDNMGTDELIDSVNSRYN